MEGRPRNVHMCSSFVRIRSSLLPKSQGALQVARSPAGHRAVGAQFSQTDIKSLLLTSVYHFLGLDH